MKIRKREEPLVDKAEGLCAGLPYNTELSSSAGCSIHFWCGESFYDQKLEQALKVARAHRDIVSASASLGLPTSFWAHSDMK